MTTKLAAFTRGYIECALWCGVMAYESDPVEGSEPMLEYADSDYSADDQDLLADENGNVSLM